MDLCTMEISLGSQNLQDYVSNGCVHPSIKWDLCTDGVKICSQVFGQWNPQYRGDKKNSWNTGIIQFHEISHPFSEKF